MRPLKILTSALVAGLFAAPVFVATAAYAAPPPPHAANAGERGAKHEARLVEKIKRQGITEAKAKSVVAVLKKYRPEMRALHQDMKSAKQALEKNKDDKAARDRMQALKQKREGIKQRRDGEIAKILTPAEHAKVKTLFDHKGKRHDHAKEGAKT